MTGRTGVLTEDLHLRQDGQEQEQEQPTVQEQPRCECAKRTLVAGVEVVVAR